MKPHKLPKRILDLWLPALRSGKYTQAKQELYNCPVKFIDDKMVLLHEKAGYCCLGLLGHLLQLPNELMHGKCFIANDPLTTELYGKALEVRYPAELIFNHDITATVNLPRILASMNDAKNQSFEQIADWIEENVEPYEESEETENEK